MLWKYLLLSLWMVHYSVAQRCPAEENLAPACFCKGFSSFSLMSCSNIMTAEELIPPIKATEGFEMLSLSIEESSILYIPSDVFKGTKFAKIHFENTQVMSLTDGDLAFEGLENELEEIRAIGTSYMATWDWHTLRNHKKLNLIDVNNIALHTVDSEFPPLLSLRSLGITKAEIAFVHPDAFAGLENLALLVLKENEIEEMSRSMLPNPANKLSHIDLSNNKLKTLPEDMFTNMPNLKDLMLNHNHFTTLKEETFSGVLNSLQMILMKGNPFRCDCRMKWMVGHRTPLYFQGLCDLPENLKGQNLKYLKHSDLYC